LSARFSLLVLSIESSVSVFNILLVSKARRVFRNREYGFSRNNNLLNKEMRGWQIWGPYKPLLSYIEKKIEII
jgi:hypothetical protein